MPIPPELEQDPARHRRAERRARPGAHADALGRLARGRLHDRDAVAARGRRPRADQRRGAARRPRRRSLHLYRALLALRRSEAALSIGAWSPLTADGDLLAYERSHAGRRLVVALNLGHEALEADVLGGGSGRVLLSTVLDRADERVAGRVWLRPDEGLIVDAERG